jgi:Zn-dependent M28 family amino/carboxypeptidase
MLGSTNAVPFVYAESRAAAGSEEITDFLAAGLDAAGFGSASIDVGGASDHAPFQDAGIPTGGLFSGASEVKTLDQKTEFGGTADAPFDPCYHLACDTAANVVTEQVASFTAIAAAAVLALARGELLP